VKTEFISKAVLDKGKCPKPTEGSQARRERRITALNPINSLAINNRMKPLAPHESPLAQLAAARVRRNLRFIPLAGAEHLLHPATVKTIARMRAAELADWQASGGDFLTSPPSAKI
jgi:hypothetical protein